MGCTKTFEDSSSGDLVISGAILDRWQSIVNLLAEFSKVPAALIMRVGDGLIEVFRRSASKGNPYHLGATEHFHLNCGLYCEHVIRTNKKLLVPNALEDPDWKENPDVPLNMISYLGFPILFPDATPFGTICVLDSKYNTYSSKIESLMLQFRDIIEFQLAQLCQCRDLETELESNRIIGHLNMDLPFVSPVNPQDRLQNLTRSLVQANQQLKNEIQMRIQVERELKRTQQEAIAASRAKSEFLANMSHEIRTPLNGIIGMLRLLQDTDLDAVQQKYTGHTVQAARRLTNLLSDILDLSRVEAGKLAIRTSSMSIRDCLSSVETMFKPAAMEKNVQIYLRISPDIPDTVLGDATRVQQILSNILGNAVKFTDKGFIEITVHPLPLQKEGEIRILFSFADTGIGISEDKLESIFNAFEQQATGYRRNNQGAGLGLAICKKLLDLMGGNVSVESTEGIGSTFHCCLPFQVDDAPLKDAPCVRYSPNSKSSILLVEDDELSQFIVKRYVQSMNLNIEVVNDGKEALDVLSQRTFDLVLMDIQMPNLDGIEATQAIRQGKAGKKNALVPIIALTAFAMRGDREKALAAGFNGHIAKPIDREELAELMRKLTVSEAG